MNINRVTSCKILGYVSLVDIISQMSKIGGTNIQRFLEYYRGQFRKIIEKHKFEYFKDFNNDILFFGNPNNIHGFIKIIIDLFRGRQIEDKFGFKVLLKMVAYLGYFHFSIDNKGKKRDIINFSASTILFTMKDIKEEGVLITKDLFIGLKLYLEKYSIPWILWNKRFEEYTHLYYLFPITEKKDRLDEDWLNEAEKSLIK